MRQWVQSTVPGYLEVLNKHELHSLSTVSFESFLNARLCAKYLLLPGVAPMPFSSVLAVSLLVPSGASGMSHEAGLDLQSPSHSHLTLSKGKGTRY